MSTSLGAGADQAVAFRTDGVVCLRGALSDATMALALAAWKWSMANPGPGAAKLPSKGSGTFYQDLANPASFAAYDALLREPAIGAIPAALWGKPDVWYMYEQIFQKSGGVTRRTPWHQDTPYLPVRGDDLAVMWISFDAVSAAQALEFVRGSHKGTLYNGSTFDPNDDTAPIYKGDVLPRLPDIEAQRANWPIVSWATQPGDVIVFHPGVLHGGAATDTSTQRRTLSLRFFGADAVVAKRPGADIEVKPERAVTNVHPLTRMRAQSDGTPFRHPAFPKIHPVPAAAS